MPQQGPATPCVAALKDGWMDVAASREIDRDEFDRLTGLADARRDLGWNLAA
jgi:hypothetical protein